MNIIYFLIAMLASAIGAISGIGGGVILKPVLDSLGTFSVPVITFMSGCTVLSMSAMSVLTGRKSSAAVNAKITVFLAIGSCLGGIAGKNVFHLVEQIFADSDTIGMIQAIVLLVINLSVFIFTLNKRRINTFHVSNRFVCVAIGFFLGILSAFLGIGGGPINIAVLFILFSMSSKEAVLNSLFIILCSQTTSLLSYFATNTVPQINPVVLTLMCIGGICGALIGRGLSKKMSNKSIDKLFGVVTFCLVLLNIFNIVKFGGAF